ncbi:MAG: hypothetical protein FVQ81_13025 [Candidatus Glassbacteria bacterium]|nr:hypothetical protein [Candidatus Glassbacteria bacterium]
MKLYIFGERYRSPVFAAAWMAATILAAHLLEFLAPGRWLLPAAAGAGFWLLFVHPLRGGEYARAIRYALGWAGMMVLVQVTLTLLWPGAMEENVIRAAAYRDEMFHWIRTGEGPEGDIAQFLPVHIRHFAIFCLLSLTSGGLLGLMMGAVLLGYMNFYAGSLIAASAGSPVAILLAWQVWAVVRVTGYIVAGAALGGALLHQRNDIGAKKKTIIRWLTLALALIVADVALKWALAGVYQQALNGALGG